MKVLKSSYRLNCLGRCPVNFVNLEVVVSGAVDLYSVMVTGMSNIKNALTDDIIDMTKY